MSVCSLICLSVVSFGWLAEKIHCCAPIGAFLCGLLKKQEMIKLIVMLSYICRVLNVPLKSACEPANDTAAVEDTAKETAVGDEEPLLGAWMQAICFLFCCR